MKGKREPAAVRFWCFVEKTAVCWLWTGRTNKDGYGVISFAERGKQMIASRLSFIIAYGPIPEGMWVLHRCDNPRCVNPDHLFLGTRADNMRDAHQKGRIDMHKVSRAGTLAHYPYFRTDD